MENRKVLFIAACLAMLMFGVACVSIGTINAYLTSAFSVDKIFIGFLASMFAAGALTGSLSFGPVVDRFGYKVLMIVSLLFLFLALEIIGHTEKLLVIQFMFFLLGLSGGIINGATSALVSDLYTEKKGAYLSFLGVFWGVGALSLPLITSILLKIEMSYPTILSLIGLLVLVPLVLFFILKCPEAKQSGGFPIRKIIWMLKNPTLVMIGFFLFFQSGFETLITTWTPKFFQESYSIDARTALISLTVLSISLTVSRVILGYLLKNIEPYKVLTGGLLMTLVGIILLKIGITNVIGLTGIALVGFGASASFPVMLGYVGSMFSELSGTAFSVVLVMALTGNMLLNALAGLVFESLGVAFFPVYIMGVIIAMIVLLYFIVVKLKKQTI